MLRRAFLIVAVCLAWFALAAQLYLLVARTIAEGGSVATGLVRYFSYFTILTNLLVAVVISSQMLPSAGRLSDFFRRPGVQAATLAYILVVGVTYSLLLRQLWQPEGLQRVVDGLLHDALPLLYALYWLLWAPKGGLRWRQIPAWLAFPLAYLAWSLLRGALTGTYPYPFLDVAKIGHSGVARSSIVLLVVFAALGTMIVGVDQFLARRRVRRAAA